MHWRFVEGLLSFWALAALAADTGPLQVIPLPQQLQPQEGSFLLRPETRLLVEARAKSAGSYLAEQLRQSTGYKVKVGSYGQSGPLAGAILMTSKGADASLGPESYELQVTPDSVVLRAAGQTGFFYGVQSLLQLFPAQVFARRLVSGVEWRAPCVVMRDWPRFSWRGLMLDVSRHFFSKAEVEQLLDLMAMHKLNIFHWHLTDNDGWRLAIRKYPRLTEVGAWREDIGYGFERRDSTAYGRDGRYGGYYTQADIREVVAYANSRHITIVPEIEMPGHSAAALRAYPQFTCSGRPADVFCPGREETFAFLEDVLAEVFELFPGPYVHVGGDEVQKENWKHCARCQERERRNGLKNEDELQSYFFRRIEEFANAHHRRLVGWTEIRQGGAPPNAVLMDWKGGAVESASEGRDVVTTPNLSCYFNSYQSLDYSAEPIAIGCNISLRQAYSFEPVPSGLAPSYRGHILGGQASLWTEYITAPDLLQYMLFPRLCALAEVVWLGAGSKQWEDFQHRLQTHYRRLDELGVNYHRDRSVRIGGWTPAQVTTQAVTLEWEITRFVTQPDKKHLILDDLCRPSTAGLLAEPGKCHVIFEHTSGRCLKIDWVALLENGRELARDTHPGLACPEPRDLVVRDVAYVLGLSGCKMGSRYVVQAHVVGAGGDDSSGNVYLDLKDTR